MVDRGIPRHGYELVNADGEKIGEVTSGTMSPMRKIGIGMGYVQTAYTALGTEIFIDVRGRKLKAVIVRPVQKINRKPEKRTLITNITRIFRFLNIRVFLYMADIHLLLVPFHKNSF